MKMTDQPHPAPPTEGGRTSKLTLWWVTGLILVLAAGAYYYVSGKKSADSADVPATAGPGGGRSGGGGGRMGGGGRFGGGPVPVSTAAVATGELRIYISGIGSVTALNTITVKSRADGELQKINFTEGQLVKAGDLLAEIDPRAYQVALEQAEGQLARDTALLENAKRDLERYQSAKEAVTQQQVDSATSAVGQYAGAVRSDQGAVSNYQLQLSYCRVTAPIDGRVGLRLIDQGNLVHSSDQTGIVVITQEEPIAVIFSVPEDDLPQIRKSLAVGQELAVDALDRNQLVHLATGKLAAVDNQIDSSTGTVKLKAIFSNQDHGLFPNQFVNIRMLTEVLANVTLVPNSAIQIGTAGRFVFVVKADSTVERRNVTVGRTEGEKTVVTEGVAVGEMVVTEGLDRLQNGSKVAARVPPAGGRGGGMGGDPAGGGGRRGGRKKPDAP